MVPHLVTALTGPLGELEQRILEAAPAIERWFRLEWMEHTPPFYSAADIRNSGFKIAAIDTDLFPQDWQHLPDQMLPLAVQAVQSVIEKTCPEARNLLILPEHHRSADAGYVRSLARLRQILMMAGLNVRFGSIEPAHTSVQQLALGDGQTLAVEPVQWSRSRLTLPDFDPCMIVLNNDLHEGIPGILEELPAQFLLPPVQSSWTVRRRWRHFGLYEDLARRLAKMLGIDPWLIAPLFAAAPAHDLRNAASVATLAERVEGVLQRVRRKYREYGVPQTPFVTIWPEGARSEGEAVSITSVADLSEEQLARLAGSQSGGSAKDFFIQEGVLTCERLDTRSVEPRVCMIDRHVVGGFYRTIAHDGASGDGLDVAQMLAAPSASFEPLAFAPTVRNAASAPNRFYIYGVLARLSMLAASYELENTTNWIEE